MRFIFALFGLFIISALPVHAANENIAGLIMDEDIVDTELKTSIYELEEWSKYRSRITEQYNDTLRKLHVEPKKLADKINRLRGYYSTTKQYQPFARPVLDRLTEYALIVEEDKDQVAVNKALLSYRRLLNSHLVNLDVLSFAILMSRVDVRFGDKNFLKKVKGILVYSLLFSYEYKGKSPKNPYSIVSYGEETRILQEIGGTINQSKVYQVSNRFYNVHDITLKDGSYLQIYMDVTAPIRSVLKNKALRKKEENEYIPQR